MPADAAGAPAYTVIPFSKKGKRKERERKQNDLVKTKKVHERDMNQERKGKGPKETAYTQGPECGATPLLIRLNLIRLEGSAIISIS